jgi:LysM repeat protein
MVPSRLRRAWLRLMADDAADPLRGRADQAHRRRQGALPQGALLLPMIAAAGLVLALLPAEVTRATPPWTWAPLPATAFGPQADRPPTPSRLGPSVGTPAASGRSAERGSSDPATSSPPEFVPQRNRAQRDDSSEAGSSPPNVTWNVFDNRPDVPLETAPIQPAAPRPAPNDPIHVVKSGDNLWTIAHRHAADLASILRWNVGVDPDRLVAGQRILVPGGSKMAPLPGALRVTSRLASPRIAPVRPAPVPLVREGDHLWPLAVRGILSRRFSAAHPGIDIAAPQGTTVRAIADGTVVWAGWKDNGGGYVVEIEHPDGMRSTYNHNSKVVVERGDHVAQGEAIALVGMTGWATGPHLDFRVRMGGRLVDPLGLY